MKRIIYKTKKYLAAVFLGTIILSCSDSYLDVKPIAAENSGAFYLTMAQGEQAVTAAYSTFCTTAIWDRNRIMGCGDIPSDDAESGGDFENEVPGMEEFNRFTHTPTNGNLDGLYGTLYRGVYFSNLALEKIPNIKNTDPKADSVLIDVRVAELKFLRALNYIYLTHIFGAVPLVDHVLGPSEYSMGRSNFRALYDLIEKDLLEAIPVLPTKDKIDENNIGRPSKAAAQALLARLYLFESSYAKNYPGDARFEGLTQKWDKVLTYSEAVITSGLYRLVGIDGETYNTWRSPKTDGFRYLFTVEGDNSDEAIFEIQSVYTGASYGLSRGSSMIQWTAARYCNIGATKTATGYWGLGLPTQSLVDEFDRNDPRFKTTIAIPGDSIEISGGGTYPMNFESAYTGYYDRKYECSAQQFGSGQGSWDKSPMNVKVIRYGEVVLMAAEAAVMLNNNEKALQYINMIRTRARMCGNTGVPADLSGTVSFDQVVKERRVELAMEGFRFFDLVRWNMAVEKLNGTETPGGFPINYESPKDDFMPLPAREVSLSGGSLQQYPGW